MMRTRGEYEQEQEEENTMKASIGGSHVKGGDNIDCMEDGWIERIYCRYAMCGQNLRELKLDTERENDEGQGSCVLSKGGMIVSYFDFEYFYKTTSTRHT